MYSVDHPAAARSVQQSWDLLAPLLKGGKQFAFGFMNQRVLLNSSLVTSTALTHLEVEFTKREIGVVTFLAGVELKDFKRTLALLTTRPSVIVERGGLKRFLGANPLEGVRVTPAAKPKEEGDIVDVGMDMESFLTAQAILGPDATSPLEALLETAGAKQLAGTSMSPREMVEVAEQATRNTVRDPDGEISDLLMAVTQMLSGIKTDSLLASLPPEKQADLRGHSPGVMAAHVIEDAIAGWAAERLSTPAGAGGGGGDGDGPDRGGGGNGRGGSGTGTGGSAEEGSGSQAVVEAEVLQALLRGLRATRVAERLLEKLGQFVEQANLPKEIYERIRREVMWFTLPAEKKLAQLLNQDRYTPQEFSRFVQYVQEAMTEGRTSEASEAAEHYFSVLQKASSATRAEELKRAPELVRVLASMQTLPLLHTVAESLIAEILEETRLHWPCHLEATHCLSIVAQNAGRFEDFDFVYKVATDLKRSLSRNPPQHADCCGKALAGLLTSEALERLIESFLQRRSDTVWVRTATSLLTMMGSLGAEVAFRRLEEEPAASNRLPLIRLIRGLGPAAIEAARKRLSDERWYVVRNAAYILGDLGDPELPSQLRGAVRHPEIRVQQAAVTALLKSNAAGRGEILAEALPHLQAGVLELALEELTVLKDPASVQYLEALFGGQGEYKTGVLEKAVIALGAVPTDRAAETLYKIVADATKPLLVRRTALGGLYNHGSAMATGLVMRLDKLPAQDPLAVEMRKAP